MRARAPAFVILTPGHAVFTLGMCRGIGQQSPLCAGWNESARMNGFSWHSAQGMVTNDMSKKRPRKLASKSEPGYWRDRIFKNSYTVKGRRFETRGWCVKL